METLTKSQAKLDDELNKTVMTPTGCMVLKDLVTKVGVTRGIRYYNDVEKRSPKKDYSAVTPFVVRRVTHSLGLEFSNGVTLKHVDKAIFNYATQNCVIDDVRERSPRC